MVVCASRRGEVVDTVGDEDVWDIFYRQPPCSSHFDVAACLVPDLSTGWRYPDLLVQVYWPLEERRSRDGSCDGYPVLMCTFTQFFTPFPEI